MRHFDSQPRQPLESPEIQVIQCAGSDFNQNAGRGDGWHWHLGHFKAFRTAVLPKNDCLHCRTGHCSPQFDFGFRIVDFGLKDILSP